MNIAVVCIAVIVTVSVLKILILNKNKWKKHELRAEYGQKVKDCTNVNDQCE